MSILLNTIAYGDIKVFSSNVETLCFLKKLHSAYTMLFALQLGNQATDQFHFFTAAQLNIDILISGLISIFLKCGIVPGFCSVGHIFVEKLDQSSIQKHVPYHQLGNLLCGNDISL